MLAYEINDRLDLFQRYFSLIISEYIFKKDSEGKELKINDDWQITLLNEDEIYSERNFNSFPNFYNAKINKDKNIWTNIEVHEKNIHNYRKLFWRELDLLGINIPYFKWVDEQVFAELDFYVYWNNPSMFLILMSILRKVRSLDVSLNPLMIISKTYYDLFDFRDPKIKFLKIYIEYSHLYPVNKFYDGGWIFDVKSEDNIQFNNISQAAYALFRFLVNSNFIYSLQEVKVFYNICEKNIEKDLIKLLKLFNESLTIPIKWSFWIVYGSENAIILDPQVDWKYFSYSNPHIISYK